jgi:acetyl-CoA synthetase
VTEPIVWELDAEGVERSRTTEFMRIHGIDSYPDLVRRSREDPEWFWHAVVEYLEIPFSKPYSGVFDSSEGVEWTTWFTDGAVNLSEVCVDRWAEAQPDAVAIIDEREDGTSETTSFAELLERTARLAGGLRDLGVGVGDVVGVYLPMSAEAVIALLAVARVGAVFVPIFSGYGAEAVAARIEDPRPVVLICADGYRRRGQLIEMKETADRAIEQVGGVPAVIWADLEGRADTPIVEGRDHRWRDVVDRSAPLDAVETDAEAPVLLAYTSGTTGRPKGAVHTHGGLSVKLAQEGAFQADVRPGDRIMWATDMGWIMGPWMVVAGLANGAAIVSYGGAPNFPTHDRLFQIVAKHRLTFLGISPTFVRAIQPHGSEAIARHDLSSLQAFGSTGEPWNPDPWWWLFGEVGGRRIPIINISGGTEIGACILSVNLLQGVKPVSLGGPSLGMAVEVLDQNGNPIRETVGELAITKPWPGMTRGFWGDPKRYIETYWSRFDGVWVHGDWASIDADGFWYLHGRSDDTLNIAGKRIGPAEIESAAIELPEIVMAAAIGIPDEIKGEAIALYVVPAHDVDMDAEALASKVSDSVAEILGKSFRPKHVVVAPDLPRTRSAKLVRRAVKALALGQDPGDLSSLENPESLDHITALS